MRHGRLVTTVVALASALGAIGFARGQTPALKDAWSAWENGEILRAQTLARHALAGLK